MKQPYIASRDCVITGYPRPVRHGERIELTRRAAKYPLIRGWITPAPAADPPGNAPEAHRAPRRRAERS